MQQSSFVLTGSPPKKYIPEKRKSKAELQREEAAKPSSVIRKVIHKPTYCITQIVNRDGCKIKKNKIHYLHFQRRTKYNPSNPHPVYQIASTGCYFLHWKRKSIIRKKTNLSDTTSAFLLLHCHRNRSIPMPT